MPISPRRETRCAHFFLCRPRQATGSPRILSGLFFLWAFLNLILVVNGTAWAGADVGLAWTPCLDANVAGYKIYYGTLSQNYTSVFDAGNTTAATISNLTAGVTYYFAMATYDTSGFESALSSEATYNVPTSQLTSTSLSQIQIRQSGPGQITLTLSGQSGHTYYIEATVDLAAWTVIGTVTPTTDGPIDFTDPEAGIFPQRFYRTRE